MINATLTLHDALDVLKSNDLPSILRVQIADDIRDEFATIHSDVKKAQNRVEYLEAEIRGVIEYLEGSSGSGIFGSGSVHEQISHLKATL